MTLKNLLVIASLCALAAWMPFTNAQVDGRQETHSGVIEPAAARLNPAEAQSIAEEGFVYGLPMIMDYAVMYDFIINRNSAAWKAPFNTLRNEPRVFTSADTTVVTPNSDTPYSLVRADLPAEPIVLSVSEIDPKRCYSVHLVDNNTFNYGFIGTRMTGNGAGKFMIVGPKWQGNTPAGISKVFRSST